VTVLTIHDLGELESVALGVIGAGLVPSSVAHDSTFRLDSLTAISLALSRGLPSDAFLSSDGSARPAFQSELAAAYYELDAKRILGLGGPPTNVLLEPGEGEIRRYDPPKTPAAATPVTSSARGPAARLPNFDQYPTVLDRHLAGRCLDKLLKHPDVYTFIMGKYADSSEIWQRVYKQYV